MKKPELKLNLNINLRGKIKGTLWQKAIWAIMVVVLLLASLACVYLMFKPLSKDIKAIIDDEISSSDIIFDQKTIDSIKARQVPSVVPDTSSGKNPFSGF